MKIIDRVKAYIRQKKGSDRRSTGYALDGAADPAPAQRDRAIHEQNRDDERPVVSTAHETPEPEPAPDPITEPATDPITEPAPDPITEPAPDPITEPAPDPITEPAPDPITERASASATEPITEPATELTTAPAACPRCGATGEAPCTTPSGKATKTHKGRER